MGYSPRGRKELDTTGRLHFTFLSGPTVASQEPGAVSPAVELHTAALFDLVSWSAGLWQQNTTDWVP